MNFSLYPFPAKIGARIVFDYEELWRKKSRSTSEGIRYRLHYYYFTDKGHDNSDWSAGF